MDKKTKKIRNDNHVSTLFTVKSDGDNPNNVDASFIFVCCF